MQNVYYIGGSPCCGKSTIAERISKKYGFLHYRADDFWTEFVKKGAEEGDAWLQHISALSVDQLWLMEPEKLREQELLTYGKLFAYFIEAIQSLDKNTPVIAEGAAFLPSLISKIGVDKAHYICVVPTKQFQISHCAKRIWVKDALAFYADKEKAFSHWMERDALFAVSVLKQARQAGYEALVVDGAKTVDENFRFVVEAFML